MKGRRIRGESEVPLNGNTWADLVATLSDQGVDTLICGGIAPDTRESIRSRDMEVIENVAGTGEEVLDGPGQRAGFGSGFGHWAARLGRTSGLRWPNGDPEVEAAGPMIGGLDGEDVDFSGLHPRRLPGVHGPYLPPGGTLSPFSTSPLDPHRMKKHWRILESTWDVALEEERTLCRLAELVYFGLEMGYQRLGVAFCEDLREPATILTRVLRRFFEVVPVGCKVRGGPRAPGSIDRTHRQSHGTEVPVIPGLSLTSSTQENRPECPGGLLCRC